MLSELPLAEEIAVVDVLHFGELFLLSQLFVQCYQPLGVTGGWLLEYQLSVCLAHFVHDRYIQLVSEETFASLFK
jgi:hypothetical protein